MPTSVENDNTATGAAASGTDGSEAKSSDPKRLTPTQKRVLRFIVEHAGNRTAVACTKESMARELGCCVRAIDRAVRGLRSDGLIEVRPQYLPTGGQTANTYHISKTGLILEAQLRSQRSVR